MQIHSKSWTDHSPGQQRSSKLCIRDHLEEVGSPQGISRVAEHTGMDPGSWSSWAIWHCPQNPLDRDEQVRNVNCIQELDDPYSTPFDYCTLMTDLSEGYASLFLDPITFTISLKNAKQLSKVTDANRNYFQQIKHLWYLIGDLKQQTSWHHLRTVRPESLHFIPRISSWGVKG